MTAPRASLASFPIALPAKGTATRPETLPDVQGVEEPGPAPPPARPDQSWQSRQMVEAPLPNAGQVSINIRMPPEVHHQLKLMAFESGVSINKLMLAAIAEYMAAHGQ